MILLVVVGGSRQSIDLLHHLSLDLFAVAN